jgi:hypothetical protein
MERLVLLAVAALVACGDEELGPSILPKIGGVWNYSETRNDQVHSISCNDTGTLNLTHSGDILNPDGTLIGATFTGTLNQTGVCTGPGGSSDNSGSGIVFDGRVSLGQVVGTNVSFSFRFPVPFCSGVREYGGAFSYGSGNYGVGGQSNRMSGTSLCTSQEAGETFNFTGNWQASH